MSGHIRVMVVDDSALICQLVTTILSRDPTIEVVGTAPNGRVALSRINELRPDILTLDVEMPEMDGLEFLRILRKEHRNLPVVMLSTHTERGASITLDCLYLGADDYITKPTALEPEGLLSLARELIAKIKLHTVPPPRFEPASLSAVAKAPRFAAPPGRTARVQAVVVGSSTGGPNALTDLLCALTPRFPVPVLIVQHMPPLFTKTLADRLASQSGLDVREALNGASLSPRAVWIAPGDHHLEVMPGPSGLKLVVHQGPHENSCRPSVDVLFRSAAYAYGPGVLAVILTGMGRDGLSGCRRIRESGGRILVQDAPSSVVWGMPGCIAEAGLAEAVLPPREIGFEVSRRVRESGVAWS